MDLFATISDLGGNILYYVVPFLCVLTVVVFFHELGHFLVARWCGIGVKAFSIGFGPEIWAFVDKHGTRWRLAWIPLGGYVKFAGDDNPASVPDHEALENMSEEERQTSFHAKPLVQRAAVVAAGPIANFILAIVIFASIFMLVGQRITVPRVDSVTVGSAAERAGFLQGDIIKSIDGDAIESFSEMQRIVSLSANHELRIGVDRGGADIMLTAVPDLKEIKDRFGNVHKVGLLGIRRDTKAGDWTVKHHNPVSAVILAGKETYFVVERTLGYLVKVVVGRESGDQLGGPLRIAQISGQVASLGILALINMTAILSIGIGLINLFPIPMLDGGHLMFYAIEAVRKRPLSEQAMEISFRIGLAVVLMLMIAATLNDLIHLKLL